MEILRQLHLKLAVLLITSELVEAAMPLAIRHQPLDQSVLLFQQAAFAVTASGTGPLSYQWRKEGLPIVGATNSQLILIRPGFSDAGRYSAVVSNAERSIASTTAELRVNPPDAGDLDYSFTRAIPSDYPVASGSSTDGEVNVVAVEADVIYCTVGSQRDGHNS